MMKYMFMDGPFKGSVIKTKATKVELNSKPDIEIKFVAGPLDGLVSRSLICYDRKMVEARELKANPVMGSTYNYTLDISYGTSSY